MSLTLHISVKQKARMNLKILFRLIIQGLILLDCVHTVTCNQFFFNSTSQIQVTTREIPLSNGFDFSFNTCKGGTLLSQKGTNNGFFLLEVVPTIVNYSNLLSPLFIRSHLKMTWNVNGVREFITLGSDLDRNFKHTVQFTPGSGSVNSTLRLSGITSSSVDVPNSILRFSNSGPLYAGFDVSGGEGFVGCIKSGTNIQLTDTGIAINIKRSNCQTLTCPPKVCPIGYTDYYCQVNIDDCSPNQCHHYSTCIDLIGNYSCSCGPRWTGRHCNTFLGSLCNATICKNNGICQDTPDKNNYTCICQRGFTGRNCDSVLDPCDSSPCKNGGNCSKLLTTDDFQCVCPSGFRGKTCNININECLSSPCGQGYCIDGINNYTCNCTGSGFFGPKCADDINECETNNPCHHNATCINHRGTYQCDCQPGFTGKNCYENIDDCRSNPCKNGGSCDDKVSGYICNCAVGFNGTHCGNNIDDCVSHTCNNFSLCQDSVNSYTCVCKPGYTGVNCTSDINECDSSPCQNGGTCTHGINYYSCSCPSRYTGRNCEVDLVDDCMNHTCLNNGSCVDGVNHFNCTCLPGFEGPRCENETKKCDSSPCLNNGTCIDTFNNDYRCNCTPGFTGQACDEDINECVNSTYPCRCGRCVNTPGSFHCICGQGVTGERCDQDINECTDTSLCNGGICKNHDLTTKDCQEPRFQCFCRNGFQGLNCEQNVDDCLSSPCKNGATCTDRTYNYTCTCAAGWKGRNCDIDVNECDYSVCQHGANCTNLDGSYSCTCVPGYTDVNCSSDIDECQSNPCVNGNCTDLINDFNCSCIPGFEGKNCSQDINECYPNPCINGTCEDLLADFNCTCPANYTGKRCELKISSCEPNNPCFNNGSCILQPQTHNYTCECAAGFTGLHCENITTVGFSGSSFMTLQLTSQRFEVSLQFRTTLSHGLLAADSNNNFLVFLDKENITLEYNRTKLAAGQTANISNGLWHTVHINISKVSVKMSVDNSSCGPHCEASSALHTQVTITDLRFGGSPFAAIVRQNMENFTGCIQDVMIDRRTVIPTDTQVILVNTSTGCPRREVCAPNPCAHGKCVDEWIKYSCECARRWIGPQCNTSLIPGTFGATEPLNVASSRRRRDTQSMRNASFAKFLTNDTSFGSTGELSFFVRTREMRGLVVLMAGGNRDHVAVVISEGALVVQVKINGANSNVTISGSDTVSDGSWHFVEVKGNELRFDNLSQNTRPTEGQSINLTFTYIGGLDYISLYPDGYLIKAPFRGCLQDIRLNNKLFDFGFNDASSFTGSERYALIGSGQMGEGCRGMNVCRSAPCGDGGFCRDLWNKYQCDCKPRYGGFDCASYGCSLVNLCPADTTCTDVGEHYECVHPVTFNGSSSRAQFTFTSRVNVSLSVSLRMRTRQRSTLLIEINESSSSFFKMQISHGRVIVLYNLLGESGIVFPDAIVSDGQWHNVMFNVTNDRSYVRVDGSTTSNSSSSHITDITSLLQRTPVRVGQSSFKGCIDGLRIGGLLLPFIDYYNSSLNVSHVTPLKPHFNSSVSGVRLGCHSDDVCTDNPCVRGLCGDAWNLFTCACPEGWAGNTCNLTANMTCAHSPCVNGTCYNLTHVDFSTNQSQLSDVGFDMFQCNCTPGFEGKRCENDTKECVPNPCNNGGNCTELHLNYTCNCVKGFTGRNCEENIDDCKDNNCSNNSTCNDGIDSYNCSCLSGFNGTFCQQDINECAATPLPYGPCNATGTLFCNNTYGSFECVCKQGYFGKFCEFDPTQSCEERMPCGKNGNCSDNATGFSCSCFQGFNGTLCDNDIRECDAEPCLNHGTCIDSHVNRSAPFFPGYKCQCTVDYTGKQCETEVNLCDDEPCKNNATCLRLAYNKYRCNCTPEYKGQNCTIFKPCYSQPCKNGATCHPTYDPVSNYTCTCALGFYGRNCENITNYCSPDPCRNNATCVNLNTQGKYSCNCTEGFGNVNCSGRLANCIPEPCIHGVCIPLMHDYRCKCNPGYKGINCSELIDKCKSNPCQHDGTCQTLPDDFKCDCSSGWLGKQCQFQNPCTDNPCENGATCNKFDEFGNFSCMCTEDFTGERCQTSLGPTSGKNQSDPSPLLIGGVVVASILAILFLVLLILLLRKRASNGTYSPSKEEGEAGRVELDSILKPPPQERLI